MSSTTTTVSTASTTTTTQPQQQPQPLQPYQPSIDQQKQEIQVLLNEKSYCGQQYALINQKWWENFKHYIDLEDPTTVAEGRRHVDTSYVPLPIDNENLLEPLEEWSQSSNGAGASDADPPPPPPPVAEVGTGAEVTLPSLSGGGAKNKKRILKENLILNEDYSCIPVNTWDRLRKWYGGGPEIIRSMIEVGETKNLQVEVYLLKLEMLRPDSRPNRVFIEISKSAKVKDLVYRVASIGYIPPFKCNLTIQVPGSQEWKKFILKDNRLTLDEAAITKGTLLFGSSDSSTNYEELERKVLSLESGKFMLGDVMEEDSDDDEHKLLRNSGHGAGWSGDTPSHGVTGLQNLGNTCFMNSALQCLSNTVPLTDYFMKELYLNEINRNNRLGTGGKLVDEYANLIKKIWNGNYRVLSPSQIKWIIGRVAPQFDGNRQHDAQELLVSVLDFLHEDLNRVHNKPNVTLKENNGRSDNELSREAWEAHLTRNQSFIVDHFHGQLKSTVTCPDPSCGHVSITFDPLVYLSLPLPELYEQEITFTYVSLVREKAIRYRMTFDKRDTILKLKETLKSLQHINSTKELVVADVQMGTIYSLRADEDSLSEINPNDSTTIFQVQTTINPEKEIIHIRVGHCIPYHYFASYSMSWENIGANRVISVVVSPKNHQISIEELYQQLAQAFYFGSLPHFNFRDFLSLFTIDLTYIQRYTRGDKEKLIQPDTIVTLSQGDKLFLNWKEKAIYYNRNVDETVDVLQQQKQRKEPQVITLDQCLNKFHEKEELSKTDTWYCSKCREHKQATKKFDLWKCPSILIIHLKRFQFTRRNRNKISSFVRFPLNNLNLSQHIIGEDQQHQLDHPPIYDLFAVSVHSGDLGAGHYIAYAFNTFHKKWYLFNDSSVSACDPQEVSSAEAYLLFYKRRTKDNNSTDTSTTTTTTSTTSSEK